MICEHCGSDEKCTLTERGGFCHRWQDGDHAPCVRDAKIEMIARKMAVAETAARPEGPWRGAEESWRYYLPEAHKWLAAFEVCEPFAELLASREFAKKPT